MNTQFNYHHLRYFHAVASQGGIKAAARLLSLSAPTLSMQVQELEAYLGVKLFRRENRAMRLTDAGRVVQRYAERIFSLGDEMLEVVRRGGTSGTETVFLGIADSVPKLVAARLLNKAWEELPALRIVVREGLPGELFPALATHQLDLVLANEPAPSSFKTALFSLRVGRFGVRFVAAPALAERFRSRRSLNGFPILVPARESALRREFDQHWAEAGIQPDIRAEFDDTAAMFELAAAGVGAAPVFDAVVKDVAQRYGLVELPGRTGIQEELFLVTAERQVTSPGPKAITRLARELSAVKPAAGRRARAGA